MHPANQFRPWFRGKSRGLSETRRIQRPVNYEFIVGNDFNRFAVDFRDQSQQVELVDRLCRYIENTVLLRVWNDVIANDPGDLDRRKSREHSPGVPFDLTFLREKPVN